MKKLVLVALAVALLLTPLAVVADGDHSKEPEKVSATVRMEQAQARLKVIESDDITAFQARTLGRLSTLREIEALNVILRIEGQIDERKKEAAAEAAAAAKGGVVAPKPKPEPAPEK